MCVLVSRHGFGMSGLVFRCLDQYFGCQNLYVGCLNLYIGFWTCIWVSELVFGCLNLFEGLNQNFGCLNVCLASLNLYVMCLNLYVGSGHACGYLDLHLGCLDLCFGFQGLYWGCQDMHLQWDLLSSRSKESLHLSVWCLLDLGLQRDLLLEQCTLTKYTFTEWSVLFWMLLSILLCIPGIYPVWVARTNVFIPRRRFSYWNQHRISARKAFHAHSFETVFAEYRGRLTSTRSY
jgi:hypothetical protein